MRNNTSTMMWWDILANISPYHITRRHLVGGMRKDDPGEGGDSEFQDTHDCRRMYGWVRQIVYAESVRNGALENGFHIGRSPASSV
jgi:hypothetical protein